MIQIVHIPQNRSKQNPHITTTLINTINYTLKKGEKIILYLNRRGTHSSIVCQDCGWSPMCPNCDIFLKVYEKDARLECHTCGHEGKIPHICPQCCGQNIIKIGIGTQQLEDSIKKIFPKNKIYRFDSDSTSKTSEKTQVLANLDSADIIIATKMITTGFNIKKVGLIAIVLLEQELSLPKYNTNEQVYSTIKQLIGRGNRNMQTTQVLIQTYNPSSPIVQLLKNGNYKDFLKETLIERKKFLYPPFFQIIEIEYKNTDKKNSENFIKNLEKAVQNFITDKKEHENTLLLSSFTGFKKKGYFYTTLTIKAKSIADIQFFIKPAIQKTRGASVKYFF